MSKIAKTVWTVGALLDVDFKTTSSACILSEYVVYLSRVLCVESFLDLIRVLKIASAPTELNVNGVVCGSRTQVVYSSLFASKNSHYLFNKL